MLQNDKPSHFLREGLSFVLWMRLIFLLIQV